MVEVIRYSPAPSRVVTFAPSPTMMTREEHQRKEGSLRSLGLRGPPRRSATVQNYSFLSSQIRPAATASLMASPSTSNMPAVAIVPRTLPEETEPSTEDGFAKATATPTAVTTSNTTRESETCQKNNKQQPRPRMESPRRSYSVMDYEPIPSSEQPSSGTTIADLPTELHFSILDHLDPIDSVCMGLTSRHFYAVHRKYCISFHGADAKMPLTTRRRGPNNVEWAWRLANQLTNLSVTSENVEKAISTLEAYAVRGATYCRKCGASKCELHRHIKEWMGDNWQYCSVMEKFVRPAPPSSEKGGSKSHLGCYRRKPTDPHACGKHRPLKTAAKPMLNRMTTV